MNDIIKRVVFNLFALRKNFLYLIFLSSPLYSQFYLIRNFNAENGLPSPEVYGLIQDSKGYMWFATDMGVSRYNGYEFKNFSTENGLPDNTVFGFCEDSKGRIWFRSFSGKLSYFLNDSINTVECNSELKNEIKKHANIMMSLYIDDGDTIWAGTTNKLVLKIAPPWKNNNVSLINIPEDGEYIYIVNDKNFIFGGNATNACVVTVYSNQGKKNWHIHPEISSFKKYSASRYYATHLEGGIFLTSINNVILKFTKNGIIDSVGQKATVIALLEDIDQKTISASYDGIRMHDKNHLRNYQSIPDFSNKSFTGIVIDKENSMWVTAEGQGVYYIPFRNNRYYTTEHGLTQSKVSCIAKRNGDILTGHLNGTLSLIRGNNIKTINLYTEKVSTGSNNRVNSIYNDKSGVYVSTSSSIFKLAEDFKSYTEFMGGGVKKIIKSKGNMVWVLQNRHIVHSDISREFKMEKEILVYQYIDEIYEDKAGVLWICEMDGLWNYKGDSLHYLGTNNKLLSSRIVNMAEDSQGRLWMASRGQGVIIKSGNDYYSIKKENGLASNMCRNLYIDTNNVVWVGSNNGLSKITPEKGNKFKYDVEIFSKKNGLLSNEVNDIIGGEEELLLAHNNGISIFNPSLLKNNSVSPPVYLTNVEIGNKTYKKDFLKLTYSQAYLKINYVGLSYKNPGSVEYKYKMEGLDTSWVYTKYTSAQFQTLNPGDYKFIVYAKNDDGYWSSNPAVLRLTVLPVWWQTLVFKIFVICFLSAIIYFLIKKRLDKIKIREKEKSELQIKVAVMELKALRAQMNPHFVFNAINSVQHFITSNDPVSSQKYLSKFAKLIRYVVDNSKPTAIPLEKELEAITLFLDLESLRFENRFEYTVHVDDKIDTDFVQIPSMLIQPYIENSIWHGIMHNPAAGKIDVRFELVNDFLKCTVKDNGVGRRKSAEYKTKQASYKHKSVGMTNTKERLEIINQVNKSSLSVNIVDLEDETGNALGTQVELFIPMN